MELVRDLTLIGHFIGLALIIGPFFARMRADGGYLFGIVLTGASIQLVTGLLLTGLAEMRLADNAKLEVNHTKIAVKLVIALVIFVVALIGYRKQRKLTADTPERKLLPLLHTAGALAIADVAVAVLWSGVVPA